MNQGPLPRREAILELLNSQTRALHAREMAARLHIAEGDYAGFNRLLSELAMTGAIVGLAGDRFRAPQEPTKRPSNERQGTLSVNARGFGFVATLGFDDNFYIPEERLGGAMHGDLVLRAAHGEVDAAARKARSCGWSPAGSPKVPGMLAASRQSAWLEPDDARIRGPIVLVGATEGEDGAAAVARITRYPESPRENPEGELEAVLGHPGDPRVEVAKILDPRRDRGGRTRRTRSREAEAYGARWPPKLLAGREDLTHLPLPTIDPEDARDHDDAVWVEREADGSYRVWVAIADVSHYVRPGTADRRGGARARLHRSTCPIARSRCCRARSRRTSARSCPTCIRLCLCVDAELDAAGTVTSFAPRSRLHEDGRPSSPTAASRARSASPSSRRASPEGRGDGRRSARRSTSCRACCARSA